MPPVTHTVLSRDAYQRYLARDRSQAHYVLVGRLIVVALLAAVFALSITESSLLAAMSSRLLDYGWRLAGLLLLALIARLLLLALIACLNAASSRNTLRAQALFASRQALWDAAWHHGRSTPTPALGCIGGRRFDVRR